MSDRTLWVDPSGGPLRVLVVEDSEVDALLVVRQLEQAGHRLAWTRAASADELTAALARQTWDVVLSDFSLPGFSGMAAFDLVGQADPFLPFIFVSGTIGEERAVDAVRRGATDYVLKDNLHRLPHAVEYALRSAETRRRAHEANEALQRSEHKFRNLIEGSLQAIIVRGEQGVLFVNQAFADIFGYPDAAAVYREGTIAHLIAPEDREWVLGLGRARLGGEMVPNSYEFRGLRLEGTPIWLSCEARAVEWDGETVLQATMVDITQRKQALERLQASEERFRDFTEATSDWFFELDADLRLRFMSESGHERTRLLAADAVGMHVLDMPAVGVDQARWNELRAILDRREPYRDFVARVPDADGHSLTVRFNAIPRWDAQGRFLGYRGTATDISAEVEAQQEAERAQAHLREAIESVPAAIYLYDADERLVAWNSRAVEFFPALEGVLRPGLTYEEALRVAGPPHVKDAEGRLEAWVAERLGDFRGAPSVVEQRLQDGRWLQVMDHRTAQGGTVCLRFDITEAKQRDLELRQAQKMEALGQLTGGVAHDFNNALQVISGYTQLAARETDQERLRGYLQTVGQAAEKAASLTGQLLAFSRKQVTHQRPLELNEIVTGVVKLLQRVLPENIAMTLTPNDEPCPIMADRGMVEQVLMNLTINARDAMPQGGEIVLETAGVSLDAAFCAANAWARPGHFAVLRLSDTGVGMDSDVLEHIFEPFYTTKEPGKGTGLGLATVYGIVRQHRGLIHVDSRPGEGTRFEIYLPWRERAGDTRPPQEPAPARGRGEAILVAEDEAEVRALMVAVLEQAGYRVLAVEDGEAAVATFREQPENIDLVVLDVVMPALGGLVVGERIRAVKPDQRLLFTSGWHDDRVAEALTADSAFLLHKPAPASRLLAKVREALGNE